MCFTSRTFSERFFNLSGYPKHERNHSTSFERKLRKNDSDNRLHESGMYEVILNRKKKKKIKQSKKQKSREITF